MKRAAIAAVFLSLFFSAHAQVKDRAVAVQETEAVVTVTKVDREKRTVTFRGPKGGVATLTVPPEAQNLDQVKPGQQYKMKYVEAVAVEIRKGGAPAAATSEEVKLAGAGPRHMVRTAPRRRRRRDRLHQPLPRGARAERQRGVAQGRR
jgi:hypothetical protein